MPSYELPVLSLPAVKYVAYAECGQPAADVAADDLAYVAYLPSTEYSGWRVALTEVGESHLLDVTGRVRAIGPAGIRNPIGAAACWGAMLLRSFDLQRQVDGTMRLTVEDVVAVLGDMTPMELYQVQAEVSARLGVPVGGMGDGMWRPGPFPPGLDSTGSSMRLTNVMGSSLSQAVSRYLATHPEVNWDQLAEFCDVVGRSLSELRVADLNWSQLKLFSQCLEVPYVALRGMN